MRLIHTSDWHIGKVFSFAGDGVMSLLQEERLKAIDRIGKHARRENAKTVLVAGDIYDQESPAAKTLARPIEAMRRFPDIAWHLIPGNHDPDRPNGLWHRLSALGLPDNVHLHREAVPIALDGKTSLLPAPLRQKHSAVDPTAWMENAATPEGHRRIGLAHGSITEFGSTSATPNLIDPARAKKAGLAYLALGDWHSTLSITPDTWYAGTPEPDRFDRPESGQALLVDLGAGTPEVTPIRTAHYRWLEERSTLQDESDIKQLEQRFRTEHEDLSQVLLRLDVRGMLSLAAIDLFERAVARTGLAAALCHLDLKRDQLIIRPSDDELDQLTGDRVIRTTIERLRTLAEDEDHADQQAASRAVWHLYLACHRRRQEAAA